MKINDKIRLAQKAIDSGLINVIILKYGKYTSAYKNDPYRFRHEIEENNELYNEFIKDHKHFIGIWCAYVIATNEIGPYDEIARAAFVEAYLTTRLYSDYLELAMNIV